jgi:prepilin-type N-terminal cleavage/methylation domain-containing protein
MIKRMEKSGKRRQGFTLIELMVSMVIFVIFMGIVASSYVDIIRAQKETNEIRKMYAEVRGFVDMLSQEAKLGTIDYACYEGTGDYCPVRDLARIAAGSGMTADLALVRKDGLQKTIFRFSRDRLNSANNKIQVAKYEKRTGGTWDYAPGYNGFRDIMGDLVKVEKLSFAINPDSDPYARENYAKSSKQFQPKITVYLTAKNKVSARSGFSIDFQTTISSRVYSRL